MNIEKSDIETKNENRQLSQWETPVLLELDASFSESLNFTNLLDGDTGPKPS